MSYRFITRKIRTAHHSRTDCGPNFRITDRANKFVLISIKVPDHGPDHFTTDRHCGPRTETRTEFYTDRTVPISDVLRYQRWGQWTTYLVFEPVYQSYCMTHKICAISIKNNNDSYFEYHTVNQLSFCSVRFDSLAPPILAYLALIVMIYLYLRPLASLNRSR